MLLTDKKDNAKIRQCVVELYKARAQFDEIQKSYEEQKKRLTTTIKNYMYCNKGCNEGFSFHVGSKDENKLLKVSKIEPTSIVWDADKVEQALDKESSKQVIEKTYVVNDMEGLVSYLKSCGVNPKRFKSFIDVQKSVNVEVLEQLNAIGTIDKEDLEGCYDLNKRSSYLRLSIVEGEE